MARTDTMQTKPAHVHRETIDYDEQGRCLGTCHLCGQVREYDPQGRKPPLVIKEGNMGQTAKDTSSTANTRQRHIRERHTYYEQHKAEILNDLEVLGLQGCWDKWQIRSSTWTGLKRRWGLTSVHPAKPPADLPTTNTDNPGSRPAFPPFNEAWPPQVKVVWLDTYAKLFSSSENLTKEDNNGRIFRLPGKQDH